MDWSNLGCYQLQKINFFMMKIMNQESWLLLILLQTLKTESDHLPLVHQTRLFQELLIRLGGSTDDSIINVAAIFKNFKWANF